MKKALKMMAAAAAMAFTLACFAGCGGSSDPYGDLEANLGGNGGSAMLADNCELSIEDGVVTIMYVDTSMSSGYMTAAYGTSISFDAASSEVAYVQINRLTLSTGESMQSSAIGSFDAASYTSTTMPEVGTFDGPEGTSPTDAYRQTITNNVNASLDLFNSYLESEGLKLTVADFGFKAY